MDHAVVRDFAARPLTEFVLDAAHTVIVDAVAGEYYRPPLQVAPDPVPVVIMDPIVREGCAVAGYLDPGRGGVLARGAVQGCEAVRAVMVELGVLQDEAVARVADPLVGVMVEPRVEDVEFRPVPLDGAPARRLALVAAPRPTDA